MTASKVYRGAVVGGPWDGRNAVSSVPYLRVHTLTTPRVVWAFDPSLPPQPTEIKTDEYRFRNGRWEHQK
jgi:hypothetical protein